MRLSFQNIIINGTFSYRRQSVSGNGASTECPMQLQKVQMVEAPIPKEQVDVDDVVAAAAAAAAEWHSRKC